MRSTASTRSVAELFGAFALVALGTALVMAAARSGTSPGAVLASPYYLIGSVDAMVDQLLEQRERYDISYILVFPLYGGLRSSSRAARRKLIRLAAL